MIGHKLQIIYNDQHKPYVYGAVRIVKGSVKNHPWGKPFVISKRRPGKEEIVYGTVKRILEKIVSQDARLKSFQSKTKATLDAKGITPRVQGGEVLPESEVTETILDDQENLIEEILLIISVNIRILSEIFPQKLKQYKINVYDYDGRIVDSIGLSKFADLLLHNRYVLIRDQFVVDLFSDKKFMSKTHQIGLKINFVEYFSQVWKAVYGITVNDLIAKLRGLTEKLSATSNIKEIIFLLQNLYTLGDFVIGVDVSIAGPVKTLLDEVANKHDEQLLQQHSLQPSLIEGQTYTFTATFTAPRFYLDPDLDQKQIRISMHVNDNPETLVMGYEEFFREMSAAFGNRSLYAKPPA